MKACPDCERPEMVGVEYGYDSPERYDGISEWRCVACGCRVGRWTGHRLEPGELEPRYGGPSRGMRGAERRP